MRNNETKNIVFDTINTLYVAIATVNEKGGSIRPEDYGLPALVEAAEKIGDKPVDVAKAVILADAAKSILMEIKNNHESELADLWIPWLEEEGEQPPIISAKPRPSNRLLARQYHGSICHANGDEI